MIVQLGSFLVIVILIMIIIYKYMSSSTLESELLDKCKKEKVDIKTAADLLLKEKIQEETDKFKLSQDKLTADINAGNISLSEANSKYTTLKTETDASISKLTTDITSLRDDLQAKQLENETLSNEKIALQSNLQTTQLENLSLINEKTNLINSTVQLPTPWLCGIDNMYAPFRVNSNKHVECMSNDGVGCFWNGDVNWCQIAMNKNGITANKPLVCKDGDYSNPNHWCSRVSRFYGLPHTTKLDKTCKEVDNIRLLGGSFGGKNELDHSSKYNTTMTVDECKKACLTDPNCTQYVYNKTSSICYPMVNRYGLQKPTDPTTKSASMDTNFKSAWCTLTGETPPTTV
jgi:hypothetical protein